MVNGGAGVLDIFFFSVPSTIKLQPLHLFKNASASADELNLEFSVASSFILPFNVAG